MLNSYKLNKSKIFKIIIFTIILFFCVASILNIVIASDSEHILHCHKDKCLHCDIVRICQIQSVTIITIMLLVTVLYTLNKNRILRIHNKVFKTITLINYKIQLNI